MPLPDKYKDPKFLQEVMNSDSDLRAPAQDDITVPSEPKFLQEINIPVHNEPKPKAKRQVKAKEKTLLEKAKGALRRKK